MNLVYCAQFRDQTGYGVAARGYLKSLDYYIRNTKSVSLKIYSSIASESDSLSQEEKALIEKYEFVDDSDIEKTLKDSYTFVWHMPPPMMCFADERFKPSPGCSPSMLKLMRASNRNISLVAWETDKVPAEWVENYEHFNTSMIITPCKWNRDTFSKTGIDCKIVPHLIENISKKSKPIPNIPANMLKDKFVIFTSSQWTHRKGFDVLLKSFFAEFGQNEDVLLILKTYDSATHNTERIKAEIAHYKGSTFFEFNKVIKGNNILVLPGFLSSENVAWLYEQSSVFALTSRGEGFSLPISEALMNKRPVVVPTSGGHIDYIHPEAGFFVDGHWDNCFLGIPPYETDGNYFECHINSTREQLRNAYNMWKDNPKSLQEKGKIGYEHIIKEKYDEKNIGMKFINCVSDSIVAKSKTQILKDKLKKCQSNSEKIKILKDSFKGETCYILATGPSLLDYDQEHLKDILKDNLVFSIKSAYDLFPNETDFHFFNAANLPLPSEGFLNEHYKYGDNEPIIVASDNYPIHSRWSPFQKHDLFFQIPIRTQIDDRFLVKTLEFDKHTLDKTLERPCGPGIMYETVMYMAEHLGVSKIVTLGWDLNNDASKNESDHKHYYEDKKFFIKGDVLPWEIKATRDATEQLADWLKSKNITLQTASKSSKISHKIERVVL